MRTRTGTRHTAHGTRHTAHGGVRWHSGGMQWCMLTDLLPARDATGTDPGRWRHGPETFLGRCRHARATESERVSALDGCEIAGSRSHPWRRPC